MKLGEAYVEITGKDVGLAAALSKAETATKKAGAAMQSHISAKAYREMVPVGTAENVTAQQYNQIVALEKTKEATAALEKETARAARTIESAQSRLRAGWAKVGQAISLYVVIPTTVAMAYAVKVAMDAEKSQSDLASALAATGDATERTFKQMTDFADAMEKISIYSDDTIESALALAKTFGLQTAELQEFTKAAMVLATKRNIPLTQAMEQLKTALKGLPAELRGIIPGIEQAKTEFDRLSLILKWGADNFYVVGAKAQTAGGKLAQMKNAITSAAEAFGGLLLPVIAKLAGYVQGAIGWLEKMPVPLRAIVLTIGLLVAGIVPLTIGLIALVAWWRSVEVAAVRAAAAQFWATNRAYLIVAMLASIAATAAAIALAYKSAEAAEKKYRDEMNKGARDAKAITDAANAPRKRSGDDQKALLEQAKQAREAAKLARDAEDAVKAKYLDQAKAIWDNYEALKARREEQERSARAAIGWTSLAELWKGAAKAGAAHRFGPVSLAIFSMGAPKNPPGWDAPQRMESGTWRAAVEIWRKQQREQERTNAFLQTIADNLRTAGALA